MFFPASDMSHPGPVLSWGDVVVYVYSWEVWWSIEEVCWSSGELWWSSRLVCLSFEEVWLSSGKGWWGGVVV